MRLRSLVALAVLAATPLLAAEDVPGHVQIPVEVYNRLVETSRLPATRPRPAPSSYALGTARVILDVQGAESRASGEAHVELTVDVLEDQWVLVPVLPAGTPVDAATVAGAPVQLVSTPAGLGWITDKKGSYSMSLSYRVDAQRSAAGWALPLPVPAAAAIQLVATLPGTGLDVAVIPAAGTRVTRLGAQTRVEATVPTTSGVQLSWRAPTARGHAISRARYTGQLVGESIVWTADLGVELFGDPTITVPLLPKDVTLSTLSVDGRDAPVLVEGNRFATLVKGMGLHAIKVGFTTAVVRHDGPPRVSLAIPAVPISRFDLTLPGRKEVKATPASNVVSRVVGAITTATVYAPMSDSVTLAWSEAVPDEIKADVRASASLYHAVHAEEGVLYVQAHLQYEVTRGATNRIHLLVPPGVQVNKIEAADGSVADWRLEPAVAGKPRVASVFLNREVDGELRLLIQYDRALGAPGQELELPLLRAPDAQRQRGMVALLSTSELTLDPGDESAGTRVGENQLPPFVRETIQKTVAHTFKYAEEPPRLVVRAHAPDPVVGKLDAQVDTLASLGEVAMTGAATVVVHVKSGRITELPLELPKDVNLLSLSGPSLRMHRAAVVDGVLRIDVSFTQEMEGELRLELTYERLLSAAQADSQIEVPTVRVRGAEVEQGRIAVEALSAVEVRAAAAEQLTAVDVAELPQQLVLRTTHPILMAYKYLQAAPPPRLALGLTRHGSVGVQEATIDRADYRTLFTRDGLQVTTCELFVRNSGQQFLRLRLPKGATVWSAFVDGKAEKPAMSEGGRADEVVVLVKIIHSTAGFAVQLVYATEGSPIRGLGRVRGVLPRPDILVTDSRWDVYVPTEMSYGSPATNLSVVKSAEEVSRDAMAQKLARSEVAGQALDPLRIEVPAAGIHYAFEKLYANQSGQDAWVVLPYASRAGAIVGSFVSGGGALLFWAGVAMFFNLDPRLPRRSRPVALAIAGAGGFLALLCVGVYHAGAGAVLLVSTLVAGLAAHPYAQRLIEKVKRVTVVPASEPSA
jgi:hypothetical protein